MAKAISVLVLIAFAVICISSIAQEDTASYWLNKGNESREMAINETQNQTAREIFLQEALEAYDKAIEIDPQLAMVAGPYLLLQLEGAIVRLDADAKEILAQQFNANLVELQEDGYIVKVEGIVPKTLSDNLGYPWAKIVTEGNTSRVIIISSPEGIISNYLQKALDADVKIVSLTPVSYEIRTTVTREILDRVLAPVGGSISPGDDSFHEGVTIETANETKRVIESKLNRIGLQDIKAQVIGNNSILIDLAGSDADTVRNIIGRPGKFEIRIQTEGNETMHVLYGDAIDSVGTPRSDQKQIWGVPFTLSEEGAQIFRKMAIDVGATKNPKNHEISMLLDKDVIFSAPLAPELAVRLENVLTRNMLVTVGPGDAGSKKAKDLYIHLREGALPVDVKVTQLEME